MLIGKKTILRVIKRDDVEEFLALSNDLSQTGEYYPMRILSEQDFRNKFAENGWWAEDSGLMMITDKSGKIIGNIGYFVSDKHIVGFEVGFRILRQEDRGKGYMTEALKIFSAFMFESKPITRLALNTISGNTPCMKAAEKAGYTHDGTLRKAIFNRGEYHDLEMFSMLKEECPKLRDVLR